MKNEITIPNASWKDNSPMDHVVAVFEIPNESRQYLIFKQSGEIYKFEYFYAEKYVQYLINGKQNG